MTPIIRTLALAFSCLAVTACVEDKAQPTSSFADKAKEKNTKKLPVLPAPKLEKSLHAAAFSAVAPQKPASILAPAPDSVEPKGKPEENANAMLATTEEKEATDFDRMLSPGEVNVVRFVLAKDVVDREPVEETDIFTTETEKIFAFVHVDNASGEPYAFRVHWEPASGPASPYGVKLNVRTAPRFRTWAWTKIKRDPGRYRAVLRTLDGEEIASREFDIEDASEEARFEDLEYETDLDGR